MSRSSDTSTVAPAAHAVPIALLAGGAAMITLLAAWSLPFLTDDAFISMRYAERLLGGHGLSWTDNLDPVEGYSNLSWVLLTAALGAIGVPLQLGVRALGFVFHLLTLPAFVVAFRPREDEGWMAAALATATFACSVPVGIWTVGGLEQPLVVCCLAWGFTLSTRLMERPRARTGVLASLPLGVLAVTRPDGLLFTAVIALVLAWRWRGSRSDLARAGLVVSGPLLFAAAQLAFRLMYYGEWVPNTAHAKLSASLDHTVDGLKYVGGGFLAAAPLSFVALVFLARVMLRRGEERGRVAMYGAAGVAWTAYVVYIGGDVFPGWRHHMPLVVVAAFLLGELGRQLARRSGSASVSRNIALVALFSVYLVVQLRNGENVRAFEEEWEWDSVAAGRLLRDVFEPARPVLAVDAAGATVFASGLPALDMLGLNDGWLARHPPASFGTGRIGHELGDGVYILSKRPDLVAFGYRLTQWPYERGARELAALPEFIERYSFTRMTVTAPRVFDFGVWVLRESEHIGVRRSPGRVEVPAWLLNGNEASRVSLDDAGMAVVRATRLEPVRVLGLELPAGAWRPTLQADGELAVEVRRGGSALDRTDGTFVLAEPGRIDVELTPPPEAAAWVRSLSLERVL